MVTFKKANWQLYLNYKENLVKLYIDTFSKGISAQFIPEDEAVNYLNEIFTAGYGIFGFSDQKIVAALLATPISFDTELPTKLQRKYSDKNSLYIAEVLVHEHFRGHGLGKKLMQYFDETIENSIQYALLRVWSENTPAVNLYKTNAYKVCGEIVQKKQTPDQKETFTMHKNYMVKSY